MIRSLDLKQLGRRIDAVDELLLALVAHRMSISLDIGAFKRATDEPVVNTEREDWRLGRAEELGKPLGLNPSFVRALIYGIIGESCKQQLIQLQGSYPQLPDTKDDEHWRAILRENLLKLTEKIAPSYDALYGNEFFASKACHSFEKMILLEEIGMLNDASGCFVDLGCATGAATLKYADRFEELVGYDVSGHMIEQANRKLDGCAADVRFSQVDLEDGIPLQNGVAAFVMMNLGTASDIWDVRSLIGEAHRVLRKGGRFFFSFYNREALVYKWECLPWPVNLAAGINHVKACLDVRVGSEVYSVHAKAYAPDDAAEFFPEGMKISRRLTYPTISPVLPNCLFQDGCVQSTVLHIDRLLAADEAGAYIIVTGEKQ